MLLDKRNGFTMIELVFVIVILGILAAIAIPRLAVTRDDAQIAKGRSDIAAIRSAIISERQTRLLRGDISYINHLDAGAGSTTLFDNNGSAANTILMYGITAASGNGHWQRTGDDSYTFTVLDTAVPFSYTRTTGTFTCVRDTSAAGELCKKLID